MSQLSHVRRVAFNAADEDLCRLLAVSKNSVIERAVALLIYVEHLNACFDQESEVSSVFLRRFFAERNGWRTLVSVLVCTPEGEVVSCLVSPIVMPQRVTVIESSMGSHCWVRQGTAELSTPLTIFQRLLWISRGDIAQHETDDPN